MPAPVPEQPRPESAPLIGLPHRRRLRQVFRSAGWPCHDTLEIELLAAGLLERCGTLGERETLRVSDAGVQVLAASLQSNRKALDRHEALVESVARRMQQQGRIAWCGLGLRAALADQNRASGRRWQRAAPDVFSLRQTSVAAYLQPAVHEIKVRRSDLLADLRRPDKRAAYLSMAGECWYVLAEGVGDAAEVPQECGVLIAHGADFSRLEVLRSAPVRSMPFEAGLPFGVWMALARTTPFPRAEDEAQAWLAECETPPAGERSADACGA